MFYIYLVTGKQRCRFLINFNYNISQRYKKKYLVYIEFLEGITNHHKKSWL